MHASIVSIHLLLLFSRIRNVFACLESIFKRMCHNTLDTGVSSDKAVKEEDINNCRNNAWSSFLYMLGLSSVIQRSIYSLYPDFGLHRNKVLFNQLITLRVTVSLSSCPYCIICTLSIKPFCTIDIVIQENLFFSLFTQR